jgi:5-methylcytosine-specific restriction endonuclease McrA
MCTECKAKEPSKPHRRTDNRSPRLRGYDAQYEVNRATVVKITSLYGLPCGICGYPFKPGEMITAEHVMPLRQGGSNDLGNLIPAHRRCNSAWRRGRRRSVPSRRP